MAQHVGIPQKRKPSVAKEVALFDERTIKLASHLIGDIEESASHGSACDATSGRRSLTAMR